MSADLAFAAERSFLAQEFLTWLWFRCEADSGEFDLGEEVPVAVVVEDALALTGWDEDGAKVTIRGGAPTLRPEAAGALAFGLTLRKAKLLVAKGEREWFLTLDGESLDMQSVKVPDAGETDEEEDALVAKLEAGEELRETVDALYAQFLALRLHDDWDRIEVPRLRDWVRLKAQQSWQQVGAHN